MGKENSEGGFKRIAKVDLNGHKAVPITSCLDDIPADIYKQLPVRARELLNQEDMQVVVDHTGQVFHRLMDGCMIFDLIRGGIYRGGGQNGR